MKLQLSPFPAKMPHEFFAALRAKKHVAGSAAPVNAGVCLVRFTHKVIHSYRLR
ncbi:hypothetical protein [Herbaspirillum autotrophicum]|uniref:hypothetical protein n=1 Tax=Herbaspirillum autotrophicum TaxID=180195 RepID=UPI000B15BAAF|nr:hypothetical protein [Herbaspirillum autotrophicum]